MGRGLLPVPLCALLRHAGVGPREQVQPPLPPPRRRPFWGGGAPPAPGGRRAAPVAPQLGWVRRGGGRGAPPRPLSGLCERGGGGSGGGPLVPWQRLLTAGGGGGMAVLARASPAPLYLEPDPRAGPRWGPSSPRPLSRGAGRPGVAVRVSGQWLAGCGAAGSPPRSLSPLSLPRGGRGSGGPAPPPHSLVCAVWAITCAAACVGAGAAAAAGCAGGSASGRGRCAKPGGASCWCPHP